MKPNELMIGDWVIDAGITSRTVYKRINRTDERSNNCVADDYKVILGEAGIKPIPITPEILEANGFIKTGYMCRCCHNLADFDNHAQLDYNLKFSTFEIKRMKNRAWTAKIYIDAHYVHELQHALRLAGLNDLADNFVIEKGGEQ